MESPQKVTTEVVRSVAPAPGILEFEVAHRFYFELIPQARELARGDTRVLRVIDEILGRSEHVWQQGMSREEREQIDEFYRERYGQSP